jgi:hypothetical protein
MYLGVSLLHSDGFYSSWAVQFSFPVAFLTVTEHSACYGRVRETYTLSNMQEWGHSREIQDGG